MTGIVLCTEGLTKSFNKNRVLNNVSLTFLPGEVHTIVGENGAGKSTLLKLIMGIYQPDSGAILLNDETCVFHTPIEAKKHSMAMVFQELSLLPEMTVFDNVFLGNEEINKGHIIEKQKMANHLRGKCVEYGIEIDTDELVKNLPLSKQLMVEVLKALMTDPDLIIFDEATSALDNREVYTLFQIIRTLKEQNKTIIFISHRIDEVFDISDRVTVLKDGEFVTTSQIGDINEDKLIEYMVGRTINEVFPPKGNTKANIIFKVIGLGKKDGSLKNINLSIHENEVVGIAGLKGHGQDTLLECIAGIQKYDAGSIYLHDKPVNQAGVRAAIKRGIILAPEDRKTQGLFLRHSIGRNLAVSSMNKRQKAGVINKKQELKFIEKAVSDVSVKCLSMYDQVDRLSGGNQQKVVLGRVLGVEPKVILFNEPTRGIDVQTKQEIYRRIRHLADNGVSVLLYSSDLLEAIGISDTVYTMYEGAITRRLSGKEINEVEIMRGAVGNVRTVL